MSNVAPDSILQVATGFMASKQLFVANESGLFAWLQESGWKMLEQRPLLGHSASLLLK